MSLFVVFAILILVRTWASLWRERVLPRIKAQVNISTHSLPYGQTCILTITLENRSRLPAPFIVCDTTLPVGLSGKPPGADPDRQRFGGITHEALSFATSLKGRERVTAQFTLYGVSRGMHRLHEVVLYLTDGLSPSGEYLKLPAALTVTVHPRHVENRVQQPSARRIGPLAVQRKLYATSLNWIDMRPYQPGDALRDVNWMASARRGEIIVLERSFSIAHDIVLVVNLEARRGEPTPSSRLADCVFEQAQAVALHCLKDEAVLSVYCNAVWMAADVKVRYHHLFTVNGPLTPRIAMDVGHAFGSLPIYPHVPFDRLLDEVSERHLQPAQIIAITPYEDDEVHIRYKRLRQSGHDVVSMLVEAPPLAEQSVGDDSLQRGEVAAR